MEVTTVGLDLAKRVFQVHGVNAEGAVVRVRTLQICLGAWSRKEPRPGFLNGAELTEAVARGCGD